MTDSWRDHALCRGMDPDLFFPERGVSIKEARDVCGQCPVQAECLEFGLREKFGIWGGEPERGRRRIRRLVNPPKPFTPAACGTRSGYSRHLDQGEDACEPCRTANGQKGRRGPLVGTFPELSNRRHVGVLNLPLDATG